MEQTPKPRLFMALLGCRPPGRLTEQHDIFFGIAASLKELVPYMQQSWPEGKQNLHLDAWREVTQVEGYEVQVQEKTAEEQMPGSRRLFFLNLGGYKHGEFEEYHYKLLLSAQNSGDAIREAKATAFFQHTGFKGAVSHIDDKYGVDVDEVYEIAEILAPVFKERYAVTLVPLEGVSEPDAVHLGYQPLWKIKE